MGEERIIDKIDFSDFDEYVAIRFNFLRRRQKSPSPRKTLRNFAIDVYCHHKGIKSTNMSGDECFLELQKMWGTTTELAISHIIAEAFFYNYISRLISHP